MPAPHTVCYSGKQVGLHMDSYILALVGLYRSPWPTLSIIVHWVTAVTEWTGRQRIYRIMCPTDTRHTVVTVTTGLLLQLPTGDATVPLGQHSKLNGLLGRSCIWPKSNHIPRHSRYIRKNTLQVKSIFPHLSKRATNNSIRCQHAQLIHCSSHPKLSCW